PAFAELRLRLEQDLGLRTGTRHYIRVLQLLGRHKADQVAAAIEASLHRQCVRAEFIEQKLHAEGNADALAPVPPNATFHLSELTPIKLPTVIVPPPDLRRFDQLLIHRSKGEDAHVGDVIEAQSENPAPADDAG